MNGTGGELPTRRRSLIRPRIPWFALLLGVVAALGVFWVSEPDEEPAGFAATVRSAAATYDPPFQSLRETVTVALNDPAVLDAVLAATGLDMDHDELLDHLELDVAVNTVFFDVIGVHPDEQTARRIARAGTQALIDRLNSVGETFGSFVTLSGETVERRSAEAVGGMRRLLVAGLAGAIVTLLVIVARDVLRRPLRSTEQVRELLGPTEVIYAQVDIVDGDRRLSIGGQPLAAAASEMTHVLVLATKRSGATLNEVVSPIHSGLRRVHADGELVHHDPARSSEAGQRPDPSDLVPRGANGKKAAPSLATTTKVGRSFASGEPAFVLVAAGGGGAVEKLVEAGTPETFFVARLGEPEANLWRLASQIEPEGRKVVVLVSPPSLAGRARRAARDAAQTLDRVVD